MSPLHRHPWVRIANFGAGWEAELAAARLKAARVPARVMGNDLVGIFGPGFQGANARGFFVEVPEPHGVRARWILAQPPDEIPEQDDGEPEA